MLLLPHAFDTFRLLRYHKGKSFHEKKPQVKKKSGPFLPINGTNFFLQSCNKSDMKWNVTRKKLINEQIAPKEVGGEKEHNFRTICYRHKNRYCEEKSN